MNKGEYILKNNSKINRNINMEIKTNNNMIKDHKDDMYNVSFKLLYLSN